ncbi:MAG TPA: amidohydrolase, partial [Bacteroidia bacterium]|nr:amidohydrolase [Bacteroidia bacterium]
MLKRIYFAVTVLFTISSASAQTTFPSNGAPNPVHTIYAFTNANIHVDQDITINNGVLVIQDGKIITTAEKATIPSSAIVYNLNGKHIYASFIDLYSNFGLAEAAQPKDGKKQNAPTEIKKGAYGWNPAIRADVEAYKEFTYN